MLQQLTSLLVATLLCAAPAGAQAPDGRFDPSMLKGPARGQPNEVMVLGSAHLAQLPAPFHPSSLGLLNARLRAWKPGIIAIESLSGAQCAYLRQFPSRFDATVQRYCWDPAPARAATGLDVPAATAAIDTQLRNWPATPTPAQRRHLAALFLAGGEVASALVQWLRLPPPNAMPATASTPPWSPCSTPLRAHAARWGKTCSSPRHWRQRWDWTA